MFSVYHIAQTKLIFLAIMELCYVSSFSGQFLWFSDLHTRAYRFESARLKLRISAFLPRSYHICICSYVPEYAFLIGSGVLIFSPLS